MFLSALFLSIYWMDLSQTSKEVSVWSKDVHIRIWLELNDFQKSFGPFMNIFVHTISQ